MQDLLVELVQVYLGHKNCLSHTPTEKEWKYIYSLAIKQGVIGITFAAMQKVRSQEQYPPETIF